MRVINEQKSLDHRKNADAGDCVLLKVREHESYGVVVEWEFVAATL